MFAAWPVCIVVSFLCLNGSQIIACWSSEPEASRLDTKKQKGKSVCTVSVKHSLFYSNQIHAQSLMDHGFDDIGSVQVWFKIHSEW